MPARVTEGNGVRQHLIHLALLLLPLAAATILMWPTLKGVLAVWASDGTYSHGFLLAAVCLWLIWRDRRRSPWPAPTIWWPGLLLTGTLVAVYLVALLAAVDVLQRLLILPLYLAVTATLIGKSPARRLLFPALLLLLAIPVWGLIIPLLQKMAVATVSTVLDWQGLPVVIHTNHIRIPEGTFEIAQGCSGLRYLLVAGAVTLLWSHLYLRRWRDRILYNLVGIAAALMTNWIRIYWLILIGHYTRMQSPLMEDHNMFGWYIFAGMLVPLLWLGRRLPQRQPAPASTTTLSVAPQSNAGPTILALLVSAGLLLPLHWRDRPESREALAFHPPIVSQPWRLQAPAAGSWQPLYLGLDQDWHLQYANDRGRYRVYLGWYDHQRDGAELNNHANRLAPRGWNVATPVSPCPAKALCREVVFQGEPHVVVRWHVVNHREVGSILAEKWQQLLAEVGGSPGAGVLAFETACHPDCHSSLNWLLSASADVRRDILRQMRHPQRSRP